MADEEVIYLIDSDSDNDNGSSSQAKDDACTSTKPIIPKKIDAAPCKPLGKSTVEKRGLIDLPRDTDSDDSDDDFLNLPVFRPKVAADQSKGIKSRNVKHQASTSKGVNLYDERMKEEQQDNGVVDLSVSGMHSRTDSSDDEVCYHIGRLDQSGTGAGSSCGNGDGDGAANETEDDDCIILSSDDDSDKHCKPSSSKGFAVAARSKEIMNDIDSDDDESDKICKPSSKRFAVAARSKEIMNDIDSDDNDDDDLPSPVPFKLQTKEKVENKRRGTFVSEHSSPNADGADLMNSTKASKGTHKQSPRGTLKDDRYYESNDSPSPRGVLKDDRHYESNDSPSSWNFISHQHSNKSEHSSPNADGAAFMNSTKASKGTHKQSLRGALKDDRHYESNDSPSSWNLISHKHSKKVNGNYGHAGLNGNNVPSLFGSASNEIVLDSDSDIDDSPRPPVGAAAKSRQPIQNSYTQSRPAPLNNTDVGLFSPPNATLPTSRQNVHNSSTSNAIQFDDLISPRASIGRPSIGSVGSTNSRRKIKVPTPAIPVKITNEIGGKLYPDFRNHFIKALIKSAKMARRAVHTKGALDGSIRAIIALAFYPFPIRSANGTMTINGIGANLVDVLKEAEKEVKKKNPPYNPPNGLYSSAAAAALVVLYKHESGKTGEDRYLSMEDLIQRVNQKSHCTTGGRLFDRDNQYYLDSNNLDPSWMQVSMVICFENTVI